MESDDLKHVVPRKRSRSPSQIPDGTNSTSNLQEISAATITPSWQSRQPKRQRKNKDIPSYDAAPDHHVLAQMGKSNPLSRKALKKDAKKARKAHRARTQAHTHAASGGGMEVDDDGLQFTFMA